MMLNLLHETTIDNQSWLPWLTIGLVVLILVTLLFGIPGSILRKVDLIGYAVCHQIESHSFAIAGSHLPLCARCTGTFLGALVGLLGQAVALRRRRASALPPVPILAVLIGFTLLWAGDGLNSYLALLSGSHIYEPTNTLRLITGSLNGLTMSALIYPIFNVSLWQTPDGQASIRNVRDLGLLLLMEAALVGVVLSRRPFLLYPLAILSAAAVLTLLSSVNTVIALIISGRENSAEAWPQALVPIAMGLFLSLLQVGLIDLIRYALTGTLDGMPELQ